MKAHRLIIPIPLPRILNQRHLSQIKEKMANTPHFHPRIIDDFSHSVYHYNPETKCPKCSEHIHFKNRSTSCCRCHTRFHKYCARASNFGAFSIEDKSWNASYNNNNIYFYVCDRCVKHIKKTTSLRI